MPYWFVLVLGFFRSARSSLSCLRSSSEGFSQLRRADPVARPEPRAVAPFPDVIGAASADFMCSTLSRTPKEHNSRHLLPPCFPAAAAITAAFANGPNYLTLFKISERAKGFEPSTPTLARFDATQIINCLFK
jgi:hypothetical protein